MLNIKCHFSEYISFISHLVYSYTRQNTHLFGIFVNTANLLFGPTSYISHRICNISHKIFIIFPVTSQSPEFGHSRQRYRSRPQADSGGECHHKSRAVRGQK